MNRPVSGETLVRRASGASVNDRPALWAAAAIAAAAFGPYVAGSVRTEQIAVYAVAFFAMGLAGLHPALRPRCLPLIGVWAAMLVLAAAGSLDAPRSPEYAPGRVVAGIDNYAAPTAILFVVSWLLTLTTPARLLRHVAVVAVAGCAASGAIAVASLVQGGTSWLPWIERFRGADGLPTVASVSEQNFRFTGIFNQPAEAGLAYSLGLLLVIYLAASDGVRQRWILLPMGLLVAAGGIVSISKVFLLVGLPVSAWLALGERRRSRAALGVLVTSAAVAWLAYLGGWFASWRGSESVVALLTGAGSGDPLQQYSAARFGSESLTGSVVHAVMKTSPWFGFGAGGLAVPYDVELTEALVVGGVVGVLLLLLSYACLGLLWSTRTSTQRSMRNLSTAALVLGLGASLGLPAFTANRASTLLWLVLGVCLLGGEVERPSDQRPGG